jgi:hypothetical protein
MQNYGAGMAVLSVAMLTMTSCAVRYPTIVPVREQQFRSHDQPAPLPLQKTDRTQFESFLGHGGNRFGRNPVPDAQAAGHQQVLEALEKDANLAIRGDVASSDFCAIASPLCAAAPIFRKRTAVTQVIDARERQPAVPDPIAVCDDEYCWIFLQAANRFTGLTVVRSVRRVKP